MQKLTIIIADDEEKIHISLKEGIEEAKKRNQLADYEIEFKSFYATGVLIKALLKNSNMGDILFLDNNFEGSRSGVDSLPKIREIAPELPIIFLTAVDDYNIFKHIKEYNVHFLNKPASWAEILFAIESSITHKDIMSDMTAQIGKLRQEADLKDVDIDDADSENEKKWAEYEKKLSELNEKIKESAENNDKDKFKDIKNKIQAKYPRFKAKYIEFLATGEFLYEIHKDLKMDFSAILISYSKGLEGLLREMMIRKKKISENDSCTLGAVVRLIAKDYSLNWDREINRKLQMFTSHRNNAAHPDGVSVSKLNKARSLLFDMERTSRSDYILDYIYVYVM